MNEDDVKIEEETPEGGAEVEIAEEENRADAKVKKLRDELEHVKKEKQEYLDGWQRAKADYVNALKRFEGDVKSAKASGVEKALEHLLPAFDALERAKEHGEIPHGFQAIAKQLESGFFGLGIEEVGKVGERFSPTLHEALGQDPVTEHKKDDTITAVLEKGYRLGESVIRPAKVRVGHFQL